MSSTNRHVLSTERAFFPLMEEFGVERSARVATDSAGLGQCGSRIVWSAKSEATQVEKVLRRLSLEEPDFPSPEFSGQTTSGAPVARVVGALVRVETARVGGVRRPRLEKPLDLSTGDDPVAR